MRRKFLLKAVSGSSVFPLIPRFAHPWSLCSVNNTNATLLTQPIFPKFVAFRRQSALRRQSSGGVESKNQHVSTGSTRAGVRICGPAVWSYQVPQKCRRHNTPWIGKFKQADKIGEPAAVVGCTGEIPVTLWVLCQLASGHRPAAADLRQDFRAGGLTV